jgi:hypothetical protein
LRGNYVEKYAEAEFNMSLIFEGDIGLGVFDGDLYICSDKIVLCRILKKKRKEVLKATWHHPTPDRTGAFHADQTSASIKYRCTPSCYRVVVPILLNPVLLERKLRAYVEK